MKKTKVILRNDFHGTKCTVVVPASGILSRRTTTRVIKELCGHSDCCCGKVRGPQDDGIGYEWVGDKESCGDLLRLFEVDDDSCYYN